ncbi:MAG: RHS repeat-associated core domain-containing protein, partial [Paludibacteraceae bacterium]|nr:RHS repeat-associated core domain-containing protein [Paludibacteraceae bacterium]
MTLYQNGSGHVYTFAYDDNGNITSITKGTTSVTYQYNGANELIRENNQFTNQTVTYTYDLWGNITEKKIYAYTTATDPGTPISTIPYGYSTGDWKDQLVSYGNQTITYDAMGNPTTYRGKTLTWRGKQLTGIAAGTDAIAYSYDENGLRLQKTVNNVVTDYYYNGKVLIGLTKGTDTLRFSYDAAGNAAAVNHNGTYYYYLRNGQGDIVKIVDGSGATVVEYSYDSWGKQLSCTGTLATTLGALNPFRYRGYVYDEETGFYYLKSRYYDPETCRFISADVYLSTGQGVLGHNSYEYCLNNPINRVDGDGNWSGWATAGLIIGAVLCVAAVTVLTCGVGTATLAGAVAVGAAKGALVGA